MIKFFLVIVTTIAISSLFISFLKDAQAGESRTIIYPPVVLSLGIIKDDGKRTPISFNDLREREDIWRKLVASREARFGPANKNVADALNTLASTIDAIESKKDNCYFGLYKWFRIWNGRYTERMHEADLLRARAENILEGKPYANAKSKFQITTNLLYDRSYCIFYFGSFFAKSISVAYLLFNVLKSLITTRRLQRHLIQPSAITVIIFVTCWTIQEIFFNPNVDVYF